MPVLWAGGCGVTEELAEFVVAPGAETDDRSAVGGQMPAQSAQHLQAVDARQADVQDRQIVDAQRQGPVGLLTVVGDVHRVSGLHQRPVKVD